MNEQFVRVNDDIELCYETFGDPADPTVLLVMGLGTQMVAWHEDFCRAIVDRGFHVVRFDNRDIGRSTHLVDVPAPTLKQLLTRDKRAAAYRLDDMAADAIGLLDHLGIEKAHVVGASMGGMIAQTIAAQYPERVRVARLDHVQHGQPLDRPAGVHRDARPAQGAAEGARGVRRVHRAPARDDRLARPRARHRGHPRDGGRRLRPPPGPARRRPPARRRHRLGRPHRGAAVDPLPRRSSSTARPTSSCARPAARRPRRRSRAPSWTDRGHGPRPPAGGVGPDHRRHRADGRRAGAPWASGDAVRRSRLDRRRELRH